MQQKKHASLGVRQTERQPEHLVVHGVGVVDLVPVGAAVRAKVVVLVRAGAGVFLDKEEADDAGAVGERAVPQLWQPRRAFPVRSVQTRILLQPAVPSLSLADARSCL